MKKIFLSFLTVIVFFNTLNLNVFATGNDYDYQALTEYEGFGKAAYETVVRETAFVTGHYTNNKEYVSQTIDEIGSYARSVYEEMEAVGESNSLKEIISAFGGYALTVGDWIKNLFNDYGESKNNNYDYFNSYVNIAHLSNSEYKIILPDGYRLNIRFEGKLSYGKDFTILNGGYLGNYRSDYGTYYRFKLNVHDYITENYIEVNKADFVPIPTNYTKFSELANYYSQYKTTFTVSKNTEVIQPPVDENVKVINNYIQNNPVSVATPKPIPTLACSGENIELKIVNGSNFVDSQDNPVDVATTGTATYNGSDCTLTWTVPNMYYAEDGSAVVEDADGIKNAETGDVISGGNNGEEVACDSVLCTTTKIVEAIGSFFEKLLDFVTKVIVPEDTSAISETFDSFTNLFNEKFAVVGTVKDTFTGSFNENEKNTLEDYYLTLPILNNKPIELFNFEYIDFAIPIAKKFVGGVTVIFTLWYVYRKITGSGGMMEK